MTKRRLEPGDLVRCVYEGFVYDFDDSLPGSFGIIVKRTKDNMWYRYSDDDFARVFQIQATEIKEDDRTVFMLAMQNEDCCRYLEGIYLEKVA